MKAFIIASVGRQVAGENVIVKMEKGFLNKDIAWEEAKKLASQRVEIVEGIQFLIEPAIYEVEIIDFENKI